MMKCIKCFLIHESLWILIFDPTRQLTRKHTRSDGVSAPCAWCRCTWTKCKFSSYANANHVEYMSRAVTVKQIFLFILSQELFPFISVDVCVFESTQWVPPCLPLWEFFGIRICSKVQVKCTFITSFNSFRFTSFWRGFSRFYGSTKSTCTSNTKKKPERIMCLLPWKNACT